jgi:hypothetical protein
MITREIAMNLRYRQEVYHKTLKCADGKTPLRVFITGKCQTWKTLPNEFRVPFKHGLYDYGAITHLNAGDWTL